MRKGHIHTHGHGSHGFTNERRVFWAALITCVFMVVEFVGGILSGSLALIADAAHMLTDAAALGLAWLAFRMSREPATGRHSYGYGRLQILVAFANGISLFFIVGWIIFEAVRRIFEPEAILSTMMLVVAVVGLLVNALVYFILHGAAQDNLNMRAAMLHVIGDILGSVAAILAAILILWLGWTAADPLLSLLVAGLVLTGAYRLVRDSGHILLQGTPPSIDVDHIIADLMENISGLDGVDHMHVWSLTEEERIVTLHVRAKAEHEGENMVSDIRIRLQEQFSIPHATIELKTPR